MNGMASQITDHSTACLTAFIKHQRILQSFALLALCEGYPPVIRRPPHTHRASKPDKIHAMAPPCEQWRYSSGGFHMRLRHLSSLILFPSPLNFAYTKITHLFWYVRNVSVVVSILRKLHHITVTSQWASWRLKSPAIDCLFNRLYG